MPTTLAATFIQSSMQAEHIKALGTGSFTVGSNAIVNRNTTDYYYVAIKTNNRFGHFTYTGNATDNRSISGFGFEPAFVHISNGHTSNGKIPMHRWDDQVGDLSQPWDNAPEANSIQAFESDGIQIGNNGSRINDADSPYYGFFMRNGTSAGGGGGGGGGGQGGGNGGGNGGGGGGGNGGGNPGGGGPPGGNGGGQNRFFNSTLRKRRKWFSGF
jgi:hypothetical protein